MVLAYENFQDAQPAAAPQVAGIDYDALDAARHKACHDAEHAAYLARKAREDALPDWYRDGLRPVGPDEPRGPTGYGWMTERGE